MDLGKARQLLDYLSRRSVSFEMPTVRAYRRMSEAERDLFNERRLQFIANAIVSTSAITDFWKMVWDASIDNYGKPWGRQGVLISGPSTSGKTSACVAVMTSMLRRVSRGFPEWRECGYLPILYIRAPKYATPRGLLLAIAAALGLEPGGRASLEDLSVMVAPVMADVRVRLVIVDEVHRMSADNVNSVTTADLLKAITDEIPATFVFSGIGIESSGLLAGALGQQLVGRNSRQIMRLFSDSGPSERQAWADVVASVVANGCLFGESDVDAARLYNRTKGSLGAVAHVLNTAAKRLIMSGIRPEEEVLTDDLLEAISVPLGVEDDSPLPLDDPMVTAQPNPKQRTTRGRGHDSAHSRSTRPS